MARCDQCKDCVVGRAGGGASLRRAVHAGYAHRRPLPSVAMATRVHLAEDCHHRNRRPRRRRRAPSPAARGRR
eukprot:4275430-Pleurochrysis_carterae.AAC.1